MYRYLSGSCNIFCGVITCPIVCVSSFLVGTTLTLSECSNCCRCLEDDFIKDREKICTYCGVGTSLQVASYMCRKGYIEFVAEYDMIR